MIDRDRLPVPSVEDFCLAKRLSAISRTGDSGVGKLYAPTAESQEPQARLAAVVPVR